MSPANQVRTVADEIATAEEALSAARILLGAGNFRSASTRAYYAAFHYALALLASRGLQAKTHQGVVSMLGQHLVSTGQLPAETARLLSRLQASRHDADYAASHVVTRDMTVSDLQDAEAFITGVKALLASKP